MKKFLCIIFLIKATCLFPFQYELAVTAIFQNESRFMKEWIEFHRAVGVEHFYLYNNLSEDDYLAVLKPYIDAGIVSLYEWPHLSKNEANFTRLQTEAYNDALKHARGVAHWLAIIDLDEFVFSPTQPDLREFLKEFEPFGGVCPNWQLYGTSGVYEIPEDKLMIECLVKKAPQKYWRNFQIKSIVQPLKVLTCGNVHFVTYLHPHFQVTELHQRFFGMKSPYVSVSRIRINHYWTRDEKFFYEQKMPRYKKWKFLNAEEEKKKLSAEYDDSALFLAPDIKRRMASPFQESIADPFDSLTEAEATP